MSRGRTENKPAGSTFRKAAASSIGLRQRRTIVAPFGIAGLKIHPTTAWPGEAVTVSFKAANATDFTSIYPVSLKINGEVIAAEVVSLPSKSTMLMQFSVGQALPGDYQVDVNNSMGKFTVLGTSVENELARVKGIKPDSGKMETSFESYVWEPDAPVGSAESPADSVTQTPDRSQTAADRLAGGIEFALDKLGDGIVYLIGFLLRPCTAIFGLFRRR